MLRAAVIASCLVSWLPSSGTAQAPLRRLRKVKEAVVKAVDSAASGTVAAAIDSSRLAKPLTPVAAILEGKPPCAADSAVSVGSTVVKAVKRELKVGDTSAAPGRGGDRPCPTPGPVGQEGPSAAPAASPSTPAAVPKGVAGAVGTAAIAAPIVGMGAKRLFGRKTRTASDLLKELLEKGRLRVEGITFLPGSDRMEPVPAALIEPLAEALAALDGRVAIHVCLEESPRAATPDQGLADRRRERVWATLLSVGAPDGAFVPVPDTPRDLVVERRPAKLGKVEVELVLSLERRP
jgi:hypothetical protein